MALSLTQRANLEHLLCEGIHDFPVNDLKASRCLEELRGAPCAYATVPDFGPGPANWSKFGSSFFLDDRQYY